MSRRAETWRPVVTHPGLYEVSDLGRVRSCARTVRRGCCLVRLRRRLLAQVPGGRALNYRRVMLDCQPRRHAYVHHLVAEAFLGPRPPGLLVLHRDDDGSNNRADNLRYGDGDENQMDRWIKANRAAIAAMEPAPF